jgi:putative ABC transport system permease protein
MFRKYFISTLRSLSKNRLISTVNILGLAISITSFIFIYQYVKRELSYDLGHPHHERVYRVAELIESADYLENSSSSPLPTGPTLLQEFPDVIENQVRLFDFQTPIITLQLEDQRKFNEPYVYFTDSSVFDMLDFNMLSGIPEEALTRPFTAAISKELAYKYFGDENPIGKKILREGFQTEFEITGVYEQPSLSHIKANLLLSFQTMANAPFLRTQWVWNPAWTYIRLAENVTVEDMEQNKFPGFVDKYYDPRSKDLTSHYLQPISDIHLNSHLEFEMGANSDMKYVVIFISCAFFLIIIAIVNFVNLSTSFSLLRAKEIGVRKVSGASRTQLIVQFLAESVIISLIAFVISLGLCFAGISLLKGLIDFEVSEIFTVSNLLGQLAVVIGIGLISGIYPAFFISSFNPLVVFRGKFISNAKGQILRKGLVITQFTIAIVMIIFTSITYQQLNLLNNKDYGYHSDDVVILNAVNSGLNNLDQLTNFKTALKAYASIEQVTTMSDIIGTNNNNHDFNTEGMEPGTWNFYPALMIDEDFINTMGLSIVAGRDFQRSYQREDSLSIIVNVAMARTLGYATPEEALGKRVNSRTGAEKIIGVVKNFNYKSFHSEIGPFALDIPARGRNGNFFFRNIGIKVANTDNQTISHIQQVWEEYVPNKPFSYKILGNELKSMYKSEQNLGKVLGIFASLTVVIACLGLFALSIFIAQQKTKEIGIRKVLGANVVNLFYVGYKEQLILIVLSFLASVPIGYFIVNSWLSDFAYRIDLTAMPFLAAGSLAILISFLTVFVNFYKTVNADPAEVLKDE